MNKSFKNNFISFTIRDDILFLNIENSINPTEKEFNEFILWWKLIFEELMNKPFCMIINIENLIMINKDYIFKWIETFKKYNHLIEKNVIATSVICSSIIAKTMLDLFFVFYTPIKPTKIFKKDEDYSEFIKHEYNKSLRK